jgi:hypothetical protein
MYQSQVHPIEGRQIPQTHVFDGLSSSLGWTFMSVPFSFRHIAAYRSNTADVRMLVSTNTCYIEIEVVIIVYS